MNQYPVGELVRCTGTFYDAANNLHDPTNVFFQVRSPSGTVTKYTFGTDAALVQESLGVYHADVSVNTEGIWYYRFYATGTGQSANETYFEALQTVFSQ